MCCYKICKQLICTVQLHQVTLRMIQGYLSHFNSWLAKSTFCHQLRCYVGLEEGGILTELSLLCTTMMVHSGTYKQFLQVGRLDWPLILLDLALSSERLCVFSVHGGICIEIFCYIFYFTC